MAFDKRISGGTERGELLEERARLEVELANEEFYFKNLPFRRQMGQIGIGMEIFVSVVVLGVIIYIGTGAFGAVVCPILLVFWVIWILGTRRRLKEDLPLTKKKLFESEMAESIKKQNKLKQEIDDIDEELRDIPISTWNDGR